MDSQFNYYANLLTSDFPEEYDQINENNDIVQSEKASPIGTTSKKSQRAKNFCWQEDILLIICAKIIRTNEKLPYWNTRGHEKLKSVPIPI